jgi:hypothetical protein
MSQKTSFLSALSALGNKAPPTTRPTTYSASGSRHRDKTETKTSATTRAALSLEGNTTRTSAIKMDSEMDVATQVCIELARSIMKIPEVNTGSFFKAIAASHDTVNKSDAVLIVTVAILESLGNPQAAKIMRNKSKTVSGFYSKLNLDDSSIRDSFVVLLFALAPEFVKMIESAVKNSLDNVSRLTSAPNTSERLGKAIGSLTLNEDISLSEARTMAIAANPYKALPKSRSSSDSSSGKASDTVLVDDSASNVGSYRSPPSRLSYLGAMDPSDRNLMRYIRERRRGNDQTFDEVFPTADKPVSAKIPSKSVRSFSYSGAESAITNEASNTFSVDKAVAAINKSESHNRNFRKVSVSDVMKAFDISKSSTIEEDEIRITPRRSNRHRISKEIITPITSNIREPFATSPETEFFRTGTMPRFEDEPIAQVTKDDIMDSSVVARNQDKSRSVLASNSAAFNSDEYFEFIKNASVS